MFVRFWFAVAFAVVASATSGCSKSDTAADACFDVSKSQELRYTSCVQQCEKNKAACALAEDLRPSGGKAASAPATTQQAAVAQPVAAEPAVKEAAQPPPAKTVSSPADMKKLAAAAKRAVTAGDAAQLRQLTHPTGKGGTLGAITSTQTDTEALIKIPVSWQGGFSGTPYETVYQWRLDNLGGSDLTVASDTAVVPIGEGHRAKADTFMKSKREQLTL